MLATDHDEVIPVEKHAPAAERCAALATRVWCASVCALLGEAQNPSS
jgi:hypothetical protein